MKSVKTLKVLLATITLAAVLTACQTTVGVDRERPAELDLNGANSISVLPFQTGLTNYEGNTNIIVLGYFSNYSSKKTKTTEEKFCDSLTSKVQEALLNEGYLNVIGSKRVQTALENGTEIPCDVYLTGYISSFDDSITYKEGTRDDGTTYDIYEKSVKVTVVYQVLDSATGRTISIQKENLREDSSRESTRGALPNSLELIEPAMDRLTTRIMKQLQPYTERKIFYLLKDKTKNPEIKAAAGYLKNSDIDSALKIYQSVYSTYGDFESGYNTALLLQAKADFDAAENLMTELYNATGNKKAMNALKDIKSEKQLSQKLQTQQILKNQK